MVQACVKYENKDAGGFSCESCGLIVSWQGMIYEKGPNLQVYFLFEKGVSSF